MIRNEVEAKNETQFRNNLHQIIYEKMFIAQMKDQEILKNSLDGIKVNRK